MPNFYSVNGAMLRPEDIANRRAATEGREMVFSSKKDLVDHLIELNTRAGKTVTQLQRGRYTEMRRDQLEVLVSNFGKEAPKEEKKPVAKAAPKAKTEK